MRGIRPAIDHVSWGSSVAYRTLHFDTDQMVKGVSTLFANHLLRRLWIQWSSASSPVELKRAVELKIENHFTVWIHTNQQTKHVSLQRSY